MAAAGGGRGMPPARLLRTHLLRTAASSCRLFHSGSSPPPAPFFTGRSSDETYAWNLVIAGHLERKNPRGAVWEYALMRKEGVEADSHTVGFLVKGCSSMAGAREGPQAHCHVLKMGFSSEVIVQTALLRAYALLGELRHARRVFDETPRRDLPMWNAILAAYAQQGCPEEALQLVRAMAKGGEGFRANEVTAMSVLSACSSLRDLKNGKLLHGFVLKNLPSLDALLCSALINTYAQCGALRSARHLFDEMPVRDVVSWTAMISGYSDNDRPAEALALFEDMAAAGVLPDEVSFLAAAAACGKLQNPDLAEALDEHARQRGLCGSTRMANALMLMHARCGNLRRACQIFGELRERTAVSWTTIMQALAMHGRGADVLVRYAQMRREGIAPDGLCFVSVLSGCNRAGLVEEGRRCFRDMAEEQRLTPWVEHCGSMVDLLCREGLLEEALGFLRSMPMKPDERMRRAFFRACESRGRPGLAARAMEELFIEEEPPPPPPLVVQDAALIGVNS